MAKISPRIQEFAEELEDQLQKETRQLFAVGKPTGVPQASKEALGRRLAKLSQAIDANAGVREAATELALSCFACFVVGDEVVPRQREMFDEEDEAENIRDELRNEAAEVREGARA